MSINMRGGGWGICGHDHTGVYLHENSLAIPNKVWKFVSMQCRQYYYTVSSNIWFMFMGLKSGTKLRFIVPFHSFARNTHKTLYFILQIKITFIHKRWYLNNTIIPWLSLLIFSVNKEVNWILKKIPKAQQGTYICQGYQKSYISVTDRITKNYQVECKLTAQIQDKTLYNDHKVWQ